MSGKINEKTYVPFTWLVAVAIFILTSEAGGIVWLTTLYTNVAQAQKDIVELKKNDASQDKKLVRMDRGVLRIQIKMGIDVPEDERGD